MWKAFFLPYSVAGWVWYINCQTTTNMVHFYSQHKPCVRNLVQFLLDILVFCGLVHISGMSEFFQPTQNLRSSAGSPLN